MSVWSRSPTPSYLTLLNVPPPFPWPQCVVDLSAFIVSSYNFINACCSLLHGFNLLLSNKQVKVWPTLLSFSPFLSSLGPTLLSFSPSLWGMSVLSDWKPELMLCMRRRSLLLAISRRIRRSWSRAVSGVRGMFARLGGRKRRGRKVTQ